MRKFLSKFLDTAKVEEIVTAYKAKNEGVDDLPVYIPKSRFDEKNNALTDAEKKMNIKPISGLTAHIFRHNYATMLYYSGISIKKAAQLMGHANTKMIMEIFVLMYKNN